ncbi:MAG: ABC transporter ATP-binding protein [Clostridia bacterium]|nr:ABC transporter ATP-binding protein [Clostridia bacterium]
MIKAVGIEKSYNGEKVLKDVSLHIKKGEFLSIMGESGSGKSTLVSILGGFLAPDLGKVYFEDKDIFSLTESEISRLRCTKMGFVFQFFRLIPTLTVQDNIYLPAIMGKKLNKENIEYANELVSKLKLEGVLNKYPSELSGGQCQRVAIVRALVYKPELIILDEPTGALDSEMEECVMKVLAQINTMQGTTIIQVTHSPKVAGYSNRIITIKDGKIQQ